VENDPADQVRLPEEAGTEVLDEREDPAANGAAYAVC
jgi:hypothetical protein